MKPPHLPLGAPGNTLRNLCSSTTFLPLSCCHLEALELRNLSLNFATRWRISESSFIFRLGLTDSQQSRSSSRLLLLLLLCIFPFGRLSIYYTSEHGTFESIRFRRNNVTRLELNCTYNSLDLPRTYFTIYFAHIQPLTAFNFPCTCSMGMVAALWFHCVWFT
jgi:hypothetical protein